MIIDSSDLIEARNRLRSGDVVAIPTETVYGLAASIDSEEGLRKIFALKERPFFDPLIVHVSSLKQAQGVVEAWPPLADFIARQFWPGPLTLVLPKAKHINSLITSGLETVAVRFPAHPSAQELIKMVGSPLAAPSANKFGRTSPSKAEHVKSEFQGTDLLIIDGGDCELGVESTVLSFSTQTNGCEQIQILRPGGITQEMLTESLRKFWPQASVIRASSQASPGHTEHHYMPKIPLVIVNRPEGGPEGAKLSHQARIKISRELNLNSEFKAAELCLDSDAAIAARELYAKMRALAESGADILFVLKLPERQGGLWTAIWDRLGRASTLQLEAQ